MRQLINNSDVRKYRQLSKQLNSDNFSGRVREVQENQLTELLSEPLALQLFDYLEEGWTIEAQTYTYISAFVFSVNADFSTYVDYALRINEEVFVIIEKAEFDGLETTVTVKGYELPTELNIVEYKQENDYTKLLNGCKYVANNKTYQYNGLRPFISWNFLINYTNDGDLKQADTGNINITGELFDKASYKEKQGAISGYQQNAMREISRIVAYLNEQDFENWEQESPEINKTKFDFVVV